jgi:hypothetical protein
MADGEQKDNRNWGKGKTQEGEEREDWHAPSNRPDRGRRTRPGQDGNFLVARNHSHLAWHFSLFVSLVVVVRGGEFRPTEKGQLSEVRTSVIREMQRRERETCQVNASLGGSWCQPSLCQELTEPITTQEAPTLKAELSQPRRKCPSVRRPEASGHVVGSHRPARFKRAGRSSNTMPDQE